MVTTLSYNQVVDFNFWSCTIFIAVHIQKDSLFNPLRLPLNFKLWNDDSTIQILTKPNIQEDFNKFKGLLYFGQRHIIIDSSPPLLIVHHLRLISQVRLTMK